MREGWPSLSIVAVVGDVGDRERMLSVFRAERPQVVAHAAAHKHVPRVPSGELAAALASLRELATSGSSEEIRAFLGSSLPEAQLNGGASPAA